MQQLPAPSGALCWQRLLAMPQLPCCKTHVSEVNRGLLRSGSALFYRVSVQGSRSQRAQAGHSSSSSKHHCLLQPVSYTLLNIPPTRSVPHGCFFCGKLQSSGGQRVAPGPSTTGWAGAAQSQDSVAVNLSVHSRLEAPGGSPPPQVVTQSPTHLRHAWNEVVSHEQILEHHPNFLPGLSAQGGESESRAGHHPRGWTPLPMRRGEPVRPERSEFCSCLGSS